MFAKTERVSVFSYQNFMSDFANKLNQIQMGMPSNTMQIRDIKSRKLFESGSNNLLAKSDVKFCWHGDQPTGQFDESLVFN